MIGILLTLAGLYALLIGLLYVFQRKLIYHPEKRIAPPSYYGLQDFSDQMIEAADGVRIQIWHHPARPGFPTVVFYHGNAGNLGDRADIYAALAGKGFGVLGLSYRGYGRSGGRPSEQGLYADARAAIGFLATQGVAAQRLILFGESLGTGVAVRMATEYDVGLLVLEAPYTSVSARAAQLYPYVPVRLMLHDTFDSLGNIGRVRAPLLLFHGELDVIIPIAHGRALLAAANAPKQAFFFPHTAHNDFDSSVLSSHVLDFARKYNLIEG